MKIPVGVSHRTFWNAAKVKGIKISSKFTGVTFKVNQHGSPYWISQVQSNGRGLTKAFEFTEQGEIEASKFYIKHTIQ